MPSCVARLRGRRHEQVGVDQEDGAAWPGNDHGPAMAGSDGAIGGKQQLLKTPVVQDYRKKWSKPSLTTPDRSCMARIGPDFVRIDPDFVRIDPDHSGSILQ